jgi:hypothetical protein
VNNPVLSFSLRAKVPEVLRNAIIADRFEIPAASVFVSTKRRLRLQMMSSHGDRSRLLVGRVTGGFAPFPAS